MPDTSGAPLNVGLKSAKVELSNLKQKVREKYDATVTRADGVRLARMVTDLSGRWTVAVAPFKSNAATAKAWPAFQCDLDVSARSLDARSKADGLAKRAHVAAGTLGVGFRSDQPSGQEWDLRFVRVLGQLRGTLCNEHDGQIDFHSVQGTRTK